MCGICGIASISPIKGRNPERAMLARLSHRGPDGEGRWQDRNVVLAMKRLSIIDLVGGQQPLFNENKTLVIVGNGEIYNYIELSKLLLRRGHHLRTRSDIELVLHLFEDEGVKCFKRLRGMFALAFFDLVEQKLYLIRDRLGEKPLHWTEIDDQLIFSSEIKSILAYKGVRKALDPQAIDDFFHYYHVLDQRSVFAHIHNLPPAHYLQFDLKSGKKEIICYWSPDNIEIATHKDPTKMIREHFVESCKLTLRADVPVGISLSGGLDSSAILAVSAKIYKEKLRAFSIGYEGHPKSDERIQAEWLANKLGVEFHEAEISTREVVEELPSLVADSDELIADIASHSIRTVSRLARKQGMKVLVGGLGGDELFWGYDWVRRVTTENVTNNANQFYEFSPAYKRAEFLLPLLYSREFKSKVGTALVQPMKTLKGKSEIARFGLDKIRDGWLVSNCLVLADRLSMSSSIELRSPFLDHRLIAGILQNRLAVNGYEYGSKYWFKKAMVSFLPAEIINRPKRGFNPPVARWLFGILSKYIFLLEDGFVMHEGIISPLAIKSVTRLWLTAPILWYTFYQLVILEIWGREFYYGVKPMDIGKSASLLK